MTVRFSPEADADLETIQNFVAADNSLAATLMTRDIAKAAIAIGTMPLRFPLLAEYHRAGLRRKVFRSYLIIYRLHADEVEIVRIIHGARDYRSLLGGDL